MYRASMASSCRQTHLMPSHSRLFSDYAPLWKRYMLVIGKLRLVLRKLIYFIADLMSNRPPFAATLPAKRQARSLFP